MPDGRPVTTNAVGKFAAVRVTTGARGWLTRKSGTVKAFTTGLMVTPRLMGPLSKTPPLPVITQV